jgi:hypothetical protein
MPTEASIARPSRGSLARHAVLAAALLASRALHAQQPAARGRIEGEITDSVHARPLAGALVMVTRLSPEPPLYFNAIADDRGRYRFDTLAAGRYTVAFTAPLLDSLDLALPARQVILAEDERVRVDMTTPSGAALRAAACPGLKLPAGQGAVIGQVTDADSERPMAGAEVLVSWTDLAFDRATLRAETKAREGSVRADSLGQFRMCGIPTETRLLLQVQHQKLAGAPVILFVDDTVGVSRRVFSLSRTGARLIPDAPVAAADDTGPPPPLTGTAILTGTVRGQGGKPLAGVQIRVEDALSSTLTDSLGRFTLSDLPAGTQTAQARKLGYFLERGQVELRSGRAVGWEVQLSRFVSLDSVRIVAQRGRYREFESNRRRGFGKYLDEAQIAKQNAFETTDLLRMLPGLRIVRDPNSSDTRVLSTRGGGFSGRCEMAVVIDGMPDQDINYIRPSDIGAMEVYVGPAEAPVQYLRKECGVIVIWTKR